MTCTCLMLAVCASMGAAPVDVRFDSAKPVWLENRETERNLSVRFRAVVEVPERERVVLRLTASTLYRAFVNGEFVGHGPARACHDYYRVDEWDVTGHLKPGKNVVAIEVAGYNASSYYVIDQPSFLQAEVLARGKVIASTAGGGVPFEASVLDERVQKVQRYGFQRPFTEVYRLAADYGQWRSNPDAAFPASPCVVVGEKKLLPRRVRYPRFEMKPAVWHVSQGTVTQGANPDAKWRDRSVTDVGPQLGGYPEAEIERFVSDEVVQTGYAVTKTVNEVMTPETKLALAENTFDIVDFGANLTGFLGATVTCDAPCRVMFLFDEMLLNNDVNIQRLGCVSAIPYELPAGRFVVESFEPYTMRFAKVVCLKGSCSVGGVHLREYVNPDGWEAQFACSDERINRLFAAGRSTFQQNAVDIFMDCPSRERAGWLCDSFFTSRVAYDLAGDAVVEKNFLENFLLPPSFKCLPDGMLPMCYPSDHYDNNFIPNWAMWFVVELQEYVTRSGDVEMAKALEPRVLALFKYFDRFKNSDGLLEKLEQWVFVEWSKANDFVQDVNYPSNMLYAGALDAAGQMYGRQELQDEAKRIRETILKQSYNGEFFVDNAMRKQDGTLEVTNNRTEVCQYFAFFFNVATQQTHPELWKKLHEEFGPNRKETKLYPEVSLANAFIGNMLRFELLSRDGRGEQILDESIDYLLYMAERTGTLWENVHDQASCNHGFASHIVHTLYRDVVGLYNVDTVNKKVTLRFTGLRLDWCEGRRPLPDGAAFLRWRKEGETIRYKLDVPAGYAVEVENPSGKELVREP